MSDFFLADDLSGALDAAAAFHDAGRRVTIGLSLEDWPDVAGEDEIVGLTTETRNLDPTAAARVISSVMAEAERRGARLAYKKIDSTLRGPVAAELGAIAATRGGERILFAPANPAVGRTVRNGELLVRGVPLANTEFAHDPISPVKDSSIRRLLGAAATERVIVPDIETEADLSAAVASMDRDGEPWIPIGSGALARPVAARLRRGQPPVAAPSHAVQEGPVLMLCGSAHFLNREQASVLARARGTSVHELRLEAPERGIAATNALLQANTSAALLVAADRADSREVLRKMAAAVGEIIGRTGVRRLFVTGGETAFAVCNELRIPRLSFGREIEPGLSLSLAKCPAGSFLIAVKPGGFGDVRTWVRAFDALNSA